MTQILAIDDDGGEEGRLSYSFSSHPDLQEFHRKFNIDPVTGEITTAVELDREEKPELQVIVVVSDHDSPPNSVTRSLLISLEDVDDNEPNFDTCPNVRASYHRVRCFLGIIHLRTINITVIFTTPFLDFFYFSR